MVSFCLNLFLEYLISFIFLSLFVECEIKSLEIVYIIFCTKYSNPLLSTLLRLTADRYYLCDKVKTGLTISLFSRVFKMVYVAQNCMHASVSFMMADDVLGGNVFAEDTRV